MQDGWTDEALWRGLVAREHRALEALIARYAREIAYFVRVVLDGVGTHQDAEECVNDLFVAAWEEIAGFDAERGAFRTWLTMRAKYLALDRRRLLQRRQALTVPTASEERQVVAAGQGIEVGTSAQPADESMDGLIERRERQLELRRALEQLPELDRQLVYMRYFRLATTEEIAAKTGLTRRAIDTRLWRARKVLRETLEALERRPHEAPSAPNRPPATPTRQRPTRA
ncbi:MAG: sigma-70 family RNA polymerase sigma factor [Ktedonobacterales bacterium]